jgi:hypothetical protein
VPARWSGFDDEWEHHVVVLVLHDVAVMDVGLGRSHAGALPLVVGQMTLLKGPDDPETPAATGGREPRPGTSPQWPPHP